MGWPAEGVHREILSLAEPTTTSRATACNQSPLDNTEAAAALEAAAHWPLTPCGVPVWRWLPPSPAPA